MYLWCAYTLNSKVFNFLDGDLTPPAVVTRPGIGLFFFFFLFSFSLLFSFKQPSWRFVELTDDALGPMQATLVCLYFEQQNLGPDTDDDRCMSVHVDRCVASLRTLLMPSKHVCSFETPLSAGCDL